MASGGTGSRRSYRVLMARRLKRVIVMRHVNVMNIFIFLIGAERVPGALNTKTFAWRQMDRWGSSDIETTGSTAESTVDPSTSEELRLSRPMLNAKEGNLFDGQKFPGPKSIECRMVLSFGFIPGSTPHNSAAAGIRSRLHPLPG